VRARLPQLGQQLGHGQPGHGARGVEGGVGGSPARQRGDLLAGARAPQRTAGDIYARLLAAEPHATAGRKRQLRVEAAKQARLSPLSFDRPVSLSNPHRFAERCARCPPAVRGLSVGLGAVEPVVGDVVGAVAGWAL